MKLVAVLHYKRLFSFVYKCVTREEVLCLHGVVRLLLRRERRCTVWHYTGGNRGKHHHLRWMIHLDVMHDASQIWMTLSVNFVCQYSSVLLARNYSDLVTMLLHHTGGELYQVGRAASESSFMDLWQEIISQFITLSLCLLSEWQHKVCLHSLIITLQPWNITWLARVTCSFYLHQEVTPE